MHASHFVTVALLSFATVAPTQGLYVVGDGLVYSEQLAEATRRTLHNHAFPGATTTDVLINQVMPLVTAHQGNLPGDGLHVYWAGANDLLDLLALPNCNPQFVIGNAMTQTANAISTLILSGAKDTHPEGQRSGPGAQWQTRAAADRRVDRERNNE